MTPVTLLFWFCLGFSFAAECSSVGCIDCIATDTCSSCDDLYDPNDNSCSSCLAFDINLPISEDNKVIVFQNGECTDKTSYIRSDSTVDAIIEIDETLVMTFDNYSLYDTGPCPFTFNGANQYRVSHWIELNMTSYLGDFTFFNISLEFSESTTIYVDVINSQLSEGVSDGSCFARQIMVNGQGELVIPKDDVVYTLFISLDDQIEMDYTISITGTFDPTNNNLNLGPSDIEALADSPYVHTFNLSTNGFYDYTPCAPAKFMKVLAFSVTFSGDYSLLIDTTTQNTYCFLSELSLTDFGADCVDYWIGDWWGVWSSSGDTQGLRVRITSSEEVTRNFIISTTDHTTDVTVEFSLICPNMCYESEGYGQCSVLTGECVCNDGYGADDCRKLCYFNETFYNGDEIVSGDDMCKFGTVNCDYDCACEGTSVLENNLCVSEECKNNVFGEDVLCRYGSDNCLSNCQCEDGYSPTTEYYCKSTLCGNGELDDGEECDGGNNCGEFCLCLDGFVPDESKPGNCQSEPVAWWIWVVVCVGVVSIVVILVIAISGLFRLSKTIHSDPSIFKTQQPTYYYDITNCTAALPSEESRYSLDPLHLDYGNENVPTAVFDTRYEEMDIKNLSKNKHMMLIIHTPNNPKFVFHFAPQVIFISPHHSFRATSYMTLHCTTKIMGMRIPYSIYFSKHPKVLKEIASLLKDKTFETWDDDDKVKMEHLMKDVTKKYRHYFEIKTEAASSTHIDMDELHLREEPIAQGASGTVFVGKYRSITVAVKMFRWENLTPEESDELKVDVVRECELMSKLRNPFIANYMGSVTYIPQISMVIQYFQLGSLGDYVRHEKPEDILLPYRLKIKMLFDCARGMAFLHENRIMHLDLKPDNLLVNSLYADSNCVAKITDFGTSRITKKKSQDKGLGTPIYIAPECYEDDYTNAGDVFSFAVLGWELFYAIEPYKEFKSVFEIKDFVKSGKRLPFDDVIPSCLKDLIDDCWKHKKDDRPSFEDISKRVIHIMEDVPNHQDLDANVSMERIETVINEKTAKVNEMLAEQDND
ncbi:Serine-threonine protein kinase [Entamoeba marina]